MDFVYLNNKSGYSFLKSSLKVNDLVRYAKEKGMSSLALTDHNNMIGVLEFVEECKKNNIKPIIGMEVYLDIYEIPLVLIATCNEGYISLCKITRYVSKYDFEEFISLDNLSKNTEGLICILPFIRSHMDSMTNDERMKLYLSLKSIFKNLYIGLECYTNNDLSKLNDARNFAETNNCNFVPIVDVISESLSNCQLNDILRAIDLNTTIDKLDTIKYEGHHFVSELKLKSIFKEDEIKVTKHIASLCDIDLSKIKGDLVKYPLKEGVNDYDYLHALAFKGLEKRLNNHVTQVYIDRLEYELSVIKKMNFVNYFLVVYDYVKFAKTHDILVGPGRGSAGGCLVAYCIGITSVDPIKYGLLFERFLNPERVSMPDIDVDFIDSKRQQVFDYIVQKYGNERCCRVMAVSTLTARACLKQVSKAYGVGDIEANEMSKRFFGVNEKQDPNMSLTKLYEENSSFRSLIATDERYAEIYKLASKLEFIPRQVTTHAAGMVISDTEVCQIMPVYCGDGETLSTQYDGHKLDDFNMFKMDLLGITNLSVIEECVNRVYQIYNVKINPYHIDIEDPLLYKTYKEHKYAGIFQFDEKLVKMASNQVSPENIMEVADVLALGRPGAKDFITNYAYRKKGKERVTYPHISLEPILKDTYGLMIYQEQIIQILCKMAKFSLGKADLIRRAISNKNEKMIEQYREEFINGCIKNNYTSKDANSVYDNIVKFANYGFNKSHSIAYGMLGLQLAYFKKYYPSIFYAAIINILNNEDKLDSYYYEMKSNNIHLLPPSINHSYGEFISERNDVRFGLKSIKKLTPSIIKIILDERENGYYKSFTDFVKRTYYKGIDKDNIILLIESGCFDEFGFNRLTLKYNIDTVILYASISVKKEDEVISFDNSLKEPIIREVDDNKMENLDAELKNLGLCLSYNPLEEKRSLFKEKGFKCISEVKPFGTTYIIGKITSVKKMRTKNNEAMGIFNVADETGIIKIVAFPEQYGLYESIIQKDMYIQVKGKANDKDGELSIIADALKLYKLLED